MTIANMELYEALKAANAPEEIAMKAAVSIAEPNNRLDQIDKRLAVLETKLDMVQWMVGGVGFGVVLLVIRSFWGG